MEPKIIKEKSLKEYLTQERCFIAENYSTKKLSLARARVKAGITTVAHHLKGVEEIYLICSGRGKVTIGDIESSEVEAGDVVVIPAGTSQKITNTGNTDLIFYCICTPRFSQYCYCNEEAQAPFG